MSGYEGQISSVQVLDASDTPGKFARDVAIRALISKAETLAYAKGRSDALDDALAAIDKRAWGQGYMADAVVFGMEVARGLVASLKTTTGD